MNLVTMKGRVSIEAEARKSKNGRSYTVLNVAVPIEDSTDEGDTKPLFVRLLTMSVRPATIMQRMSKGDSVCFQGRLQRRRWTGRDGVERETWSCWTDQLQSIHTISTAGEQVPEQPPQPAAEEPFDDSLDDGEDIPF